jgi:hypothetical protein
MPPGQQQPQVPPPSKPQGSGPTNIKLDKKSSARKSKKTRHDDSTFDSLSDSSDYSSTISSCFRTVNGAQKGMQRGTISKPQREAQVDLVNRSVPAMQQDRKRDIYPKFHGLVLIMIQ